VQPQFSSGVTQVEVYATVSDGDGRPITGLSADDFTVLENGEPQTISAFIEGDFPASVALAIDRSVSMKGTPLTVARTAGRVFVSSLRPQDRVGLIGIGSQVELLAPIDTDRARVLSALTAVDPWGTTSLHDAIIQAIDLLAGETRRRALVLLSDGVDKYSQATEVDVLNHARRHDVLVYPIALGRTRPRLFSELAAITGGRSFHLREPEKLQSTLQQIAEELRHQYLLGYNPEERATPGEWRSINVRVERPDARVRARSGYLVPGGVLMDGARFALACSHGALKMEVDIRHAAYARQGQP
jgi:Ca-activated chloride channel family protein